MMNFRTVKQNIITLLEGSEISGGYKTLGYKPRKLGADEIFNGGGIVQVRFARGNFFTPVQQGGSRFDAIYDVELLVSAKSDIDLTVIDNPLSTELQRQTALLASTDAASNADNRMDELIDYIYQLIMDTYNRYLGAEGTVSSRQITDVQKYDPESEGSFVLLTAKMELVVKLNESVPGIENIPDAILPGNSINSGVIASDGTLDDPAPAGINIVT